MAVDVECGHCGYNNEIECEHDGTVCECEDEATCECKDGENCGCGESNVDTTDTQCENCSLHLDECDDCCTECNNCPCGDKCSICGACNEDAFDGCECCHDCNMTEDDCTCYCSDCECKPCCCDNEEGSSPTTYTPPGESQTTVAPWEKRGIVIRKSDVTEGDYAEVWGLDTSVDMIAAMSEFYVLFGLAHGLVNTEDFRDEENKRKLRSVYSSSWDTKGNPQIRLGDLERKAVDLFDEHVAEIDIVLRRYVSCAVGGELRYHRAIGGSVLPHKNSGGEGKAHSRYRAWVGWKEVMEKVGPEALKDAAKLFKEIPGHGIGGQKWSLCAEILYYRLVDKSGEPVWHDERDRLEVYGPKPVFPPAVFVDRVFNAQHNGGALLNKVNWPPKNPRGWNIEYAKGHVLPAHDDAKNGGTPNWSLLVSLCNKEVQNLFSQTWETANDVRQTIGLKTTPCPSTSVQFRWLCGWCNSNPERGHHLGCQAVYQPSFSKGKLDAYFVGNSTGGVWQVEHPEWATKIPDDQWPNYNWKKWQAKEYPITADGRIQMDHDTTVNAYFQVSTYEKKSGNLIAPPKKQDNYYGGGGYHKTKLVPLLDQKLDLKGITKSQSVYSQRCSLTIYINMVAPHPSGADYGELEHQLVHIGKRVKWEELDALQGMTVREVLKIHAPNFQPEFKDKNQPELPVAEPEAKPEEPKVKTKWSTAEDFFGPFPKVSGQYIYTKTEQ